MVSGCAHMAIGQEPAGLAVRELQNGCAALRAAHSAHRLDPDRLRSDSTRSEDAKT